MFLNDRYGITDSNCAFENYLKLILRILSSDKEKPPCTGSGIIIYHFDF